MIRYPSVTELIFAMLYANDCEPVKNCDRLSKMIFAVVDKYGYRRGHVDIQEIRPLVYNIVSKLYQSGAITQEGLELKLSDNKVKTIKKVWKTIPSRIQDMVVYTKTNYNNMPDETFDKRVINYLGYRTITPDLIERANECLKRVKCRKSIQPNPGVMSNVPEDSPKSPDTVKVTFHFKPAQFDQIISQDKYNRYVLHKKYWHFVGKKTVETCHDLNESNVHIIPIDPETDKEYQDYVNKIKLILSLIEQVWLTDPSLQFGQVLSKAYTGSIPFKEDEDFIQNLEGWLKNEVHN